MQFRVQKYNDNDSFMKTLGKAYAVNLVAAGGLVTGLYLAMAIFGKKSESTTSTETAESPQPEQD